MMLRSAIIAIFTIFIACASAQHAAQRTRRLNVEKQTVDRILSTNYDANQRPPVKDSADHSAIVVIASIFINRIVWHDAYAEVDVYLRQQWEDSRLAYDVDTREGLDEVVLPANKKIWTPDTYFSNAKEKAFDSTERSRIVVEPSGYVRSSQGRTVYVPLTYGDSFPFLNSRTIKLRLGSYNYPLEDVVYIWANSPPLVVPVEASDDLMDGPIKFEEVTAGDCVGNYTVGTYSCVDVDVTFSASTFGSFAKFFLPSILLVIASWLHFWVHGSWSVPRTVSAAGPFLILAALFLFGSPSLTAPSSGVCCWLAFCLFLTFLSFVEYFIVILCGIRRSIRYVTRGSHAEDSPLTPGNETMEVAYDGKCAGFRQHDGVDLISRILFPVVFLVWCIIYFFVLY